MAFTLFCREFGNVVNRAFLVLIFWVKKLVGANFARFCNYAGNKGYLARDKDEEQESRDGQLGQGQCQCLILKRRRDKKAKMIKQ